MSAVRQSTGLADELIRASVDSIAGFQKAAELISDPALRSELLGYSLQRRAFVTDLTEIIQSHGLEPSHRGTLPGALQRGWMDVKKAIGRENTHAVLVDCEKQEDRALASYRKAEEMNLEDPLKSIVQAQADLVEGTRERLRGLRKAIEPVVEYEDDEVT